MFAVKHVSSTGAQFLVEGESVSYQQPDPTKPGAIVEVIQAGGSRVLFEYGDVFVMQGGKTIERYYLGTFEEWADRRGIQLPLPPAAADQVITAGQTDSVTITAGGAEAVMADAC